nr:MAG TPA: hypothetical protein [Bacteriophage sp.]
MWLPDKNTVFRLYEWQICIKGQMFESALSKVQ